MKKDTIEQLKAMYRVSKIREEEAKQNFSSNSYQCGYAHGMVVAFEGIFENLCVFEKANMFDD